MVTVVVNVDHLPQLYINGEFTRGRTTSLHNLALTVAAIGSTNYGQFVGQVDNVVVYDRVLSPVEIRSAFLGSPFATTSLQTRSPETGLPGNRTQKIFVRATIGLAASLGCLVSLCGGRGEALGRIWRAWALHERDVWDDWGWRLHPRIQPGEGSL